MPEERKTVLDTGDSAETDVPTIEHIKLRTIVEQTNPQSDSFSAPAQAIKSFSGMSPVFKRKVSGEIKKFQRGESGTESKQVSGKDFLSGYDTFDVMLPPHNLDHLIKLYELSAPHYAAVNAKVSNIVGLGFSLKESPKTKRELEAITDSEKTKRTRRRLNIHKEDLLELLDSLNEEDAIVEVMIKVWRDFEVTGNGYFEIGRKKDGSIGYLGHIPSQTVRVRRLRDGFVQVSGFETQFFANYGAGIDKQGNPTPPKNPIGSGVPNEILHLKKYSPVDGYYGIPDIISAIAGILGNDLATRFNLDYFENKAMPRHIITLKGAKLGGQAESNLLSFFETSLKGKNHRSLFIPLPGDTSENKVELNIDPIEVGIQDSSFSNYRKSNLSDILMVHRVPITKISVSEGASLAVAKDADKTFKEQVCAPEQRNLEKKLNKLMKEMTDAFVISLNEMTLTDENTQSQIDERRRKTGVETGNEQRNRRGEPSIEGGDELFDMNGKSSNTSETAGTVNRQRDSVRSANATDSAGQARNPKGEGRTIT